MPLRSRLHETLPNVTHCATAEDVAKQVAETVVKVGLGSLFCNDFNRLSEMHCDISCTKKLARGLARYDSAFSFTEQGKGSFLISTFYT